MNKIAFIDTEMDLTGRKLLDAGGICDNGQTIHCGSVPALFDFISQAEYTCGHNIIHHDLPLFEKNIGRDLSALKAIDTLYLSALLFPKKPYHALLKDDKLQTQELNNPLNDAIKAKDLFYDEVSAFLDTDERLKTIYVSLLNTQREFSYFFEYLQFCEPEETVDTLSDLIRDYFDGRICQNTDLKTLIEDNPVELSYCLALINTNSRYSITPPWVTRNYPDVEKVLYLLRNSPCLPGCNYCLQSLDAKKGLKTFFGFDSYRTYGGKALQEEAVVAAIHNKSILSIFPTGGGKSITFQVPALMAAQCVKGLTVVISPLQSLMKDQVDNLEASNITDAVTINGLLDPIERGKII